MIVRGSRLSGLLLLCAALVNAALLWSFHDTHWYAIDEGVFAHIAERLLSGEVLNRDVQSLHPGYINFLNAGAFALFGVDLVSLRYPLIAAAFVQSMLVWGLLATRNILMATVTSVAATAVGVIQFLNPSPHWYNLFLTVLLVCWLTWLPSTHRARVLGAGVLLGLIVLLRQLTGVWVAMAVVVVLLREGPAGSRGRDAILSRGVILVMCATLLCYLVLAGDVEIGGIVSLASWPLAILVLSLRDVAASNRVALAILSRLAAGVTVAVAPLLLYHLAHGSVNAWIADTVFASMSLGHLTVFQGGSYGLLPLAGLLSVFRPPDVAAFLSGAYWIVLPLLPAVNGLFTLQRLRTAQEVPILGIFSAFYTLVTLHLAGAIYLYFTVGLAVVAVSSFVAESSARRTAFSLPLLVWLSAVAVIFHAGQSSLRTRLETAQGVRTVTADSTWCPPIARSSLRLESRECEPYWQLTRAIEAASPERSEIFAIPNDAELYFLSGRSNPFRFYNSILGIQTVEDIELVLDRLASQPPRVVAFRPDDKYNNGASRRIMTFVRERYERFDTIAGVELYRPRSLPPQVDPR